MSTISKKISSSIPLLQSLTHRVLAIPSPFDAHVHLRQGDLAKLVVPHVKLGGVKLAYVMVSACTLFYSPQPTLII